MGSNKHINLARPRAALRRERGARRLCAVRWAGAFQGGTMKLAFIVQGHKNPAQIARLARRLACEEARVYVHVSAVSSGLDRAVRSQLRNTRNVEFVDSKPMYWNSWTFVRAIM